MDKQSPDTTDLPVGEILRRTRLHYNQSLTDIERALRIRASQIEAIETGDYAQLPGRVYAIGFVRSYSEYLGLDGDQMVKIFKSQFGGKSAKPELHFPVGAAESKTPPLWIVCASVALLFVLISLWWGTSGGGREEMRKIPPAPEVMALETPQMDPEAESPARPQEPSPEIQGPQQIAGEVAPQAAPEKTPEGIILNIQQNSWVEIKDNEGKALVSRVLKAGDKYYVPDRPDLSMSLGNAGGIEITVDGQMLKPLGGKGDVRRNIPLDAAFLKKNFAAAPGASATPAAPIAVQ